MTSKRDVRNIPAGEARDEIVQFLTAATPEDERVVLSELHPTAWIPLAQMEHDTVLIRNATNQEGETWRVEIQVTDQQRSEPVEFDVREIPPKDRHEVLTGTFDRLSPGQAFIFVNDHDPKPLYYELRSMHGDRIQWNYLTRESGAWTVKIGKTEATDTADRDVTASFDVRQIPKQERHPTIHHRYNGLTEGDVLEVIAPHEPRHLQQEFNQQYANGFDWSVRDKNTNRCIVWITKREPTEDGNSPASEDSSPGDLVVTEELDVRELPPGKRHELIFDSYNKLSAGEAFILINDHDPKPLNHQFNAEAGDAFNWEYQQKQPGEFRVLIGKEDVERSDNSTGSDSKAPF